MTRNPFTDGEPFSVAALNSLKHVFDGEGITSGGTLTPGTGDFEVDISATEYLVAGSYESLSADSVTLSSPSAEDRLDLIVANTTPAYQVVEGDPANTSGEPNAKDIPADTVLLGVVYVASDATELFASDLFDEYRTPMPNVESLATDGDEKQIPRSVGDGSVETVSHVPTVEVETHTGGGSLSDDPDIWFATLARVDIDTDTTGSHNHSVSLDIDYPNQSWTLSTSHSDGSASGTVIVYKLFY